MQEQREPEILSRTLKPLCFRHNEIMKYEEKGIRWHEGPGNEMQFVGCYHCGHVGCTVRYSPGEGYFTVIDTPDRPHFAEEPGANALQCPRHGTWLYRCKDGDSENQIAWRCGVEGCDVLVNGPLAKQSGQVNAT